MIPAAVFCLLLAAAAAGLLAHDVFAHKWAEFEWGLGFLDDEDEPGSIAADLADIPDPTWDRPFSERDRLREIPLQRQPGSAS